MIQLQDAVDFSDLIEHP